MSESNNPIKAVNTGIVGLLGILFVGLKLTGYIDWSWWLVLLPFYAGLLIALAVLLLGVLGIGVVGAFQVIRDGRRERARIARNDARRFR